MKKICNWQKNVPEKTANQTWKIPDSALLISSEKRLLLVTSKFISQNSGILIKPSMLCVRMQCCSNPIYSFFLPSSYPREYILCVIAFLLDRTQILFPPLWVITILYRWPLFEIGGGGGEGETREHPSNFLDTSKNAWHISSSTHCEMNWKKNTLTKYMLIVWNHAWYLLKNFYCSFASKILNMLSVTALLLNQT